MKKHWVDDTDPQAAMMEVMGHVTDAAVPIDREKLVDWLNRTVELGATGKEVLKLLESGYFDKEIK